jgi:hypothetical protein
MRAGVRLVGLRGQCSALTNAAHVAELGALAAEVHT